MPSLKHVAYRQGGIVLITYLYSRSNMKKYLHPFILLHTISTYSKHFWLSISCFHLDWMCTTHALDLKAKIDSEKIFSVLSRTWFERSASRPLKQMLLTTKVFVTLISNNMQSCLVIITSQLETKNQNRKPFIQYLPMHQQCPTSLLQWYDLLPFPC